MAELRTSGIPPRERMAEIAKRWRAHKGRATTMAPRAKRATPAKRPRKHIVPMAGAGSRSAMVGGSLSAAQLGPATEDIEGAGFLKSALNVASAVAPLAMMVL